MPPLIIAHRTCPLDAPENSLEGIRTGGLLGADHVEIDVRLTRDGVPVLLHDPLLVRTTLRPWPVAWASAKGVAKARLRGSAEHIPTLAEAIDALPDGVGLAIDTKDPDAAPAVAAELRNQGALDRALLWAQEERAVRWYARHAPDAAEIALLRDAMSAEAIDRFLADATAFGATAISAHQTTVDEAFIARAHQQRLRVHCWFQDEAHQARMAGMPLDGIVTDWPADARARTRTEPRGSSG